TVPTLADGVKVKIPGFLTRRLCSSLLDDVVIVREAELRETLVRLALEEHVIAEGAGALALAAGRRVAGKCKCAVVSGGNIDATVLAALLSEVRPRPPRKPRRRNTERLRNERSAKPASKAHVLSRPSAVASTPVIAIAVEESSR
ncbi:pyridoxal-phosphate dependent enzyme, partial [Xanthomonas fragariae]|uniref:pyridoxal-phosphate dependent enzyme n=1 Tax=Xanthomonas fragariae TaxID=48664 RepID=UPI00131F39D0